MDFGKKLKEVREAQKISQLELAKISGLSKLQIQQYEEEGREPLLFSALCLAEALGASLDTLTGRFD